MSHAEKIFRFKPIIMMRTEDFGGLLYDSLTKQTNVLSVGN